jgi:predicted phosphate transport protein (TIGR00153 family)
MRFRLIPRETKFFDMFDEATGLITQASEKFLAMISQWDKLAERAAELRQLEHDCDRVVARIIESLDRTFITPFDREDIHKLATTLDDVMDNMEETSHRLHSFQIDRPTEPAVALGRIIHQCCGHLQQAVALIRDLGNADRIRQHIGEIDRLETEADAIYRDSDAALFAQPPEILLLIKWREVYGWLEETVDACKDASLIVSEILVKGS